MLTKKCMLLNIKVEETIEKAQINRFSTSAQCWCPDKDKNCLYRNSMWEESWEKEDLEMCIWLEILGLALSWRSR